MQFINSLELKMKFFTNFTVFYKNSVLGTAIKMFNSICSQFKTFRRLKQPFQSPLQNLSKIYISHSLPEPNSSNKKPLNHQKSLFFLFSTLHVVTLTHSPLPPRSNLNVVVFRVILLILINVVVTKGIAVLVESNFSSLRPFERHIVNVTKHFVAWYRQQ